MKEVTVAELKALLKGAKRPLVLDVRQQAEFDAGHIEGSILIPLDQLPSRYQELAKDADIVVACRSGARSARAVDFLEQQGFTRVANLIGGNLQWQAESC